MEATHSRIARSWRPEHWAIFTIMVGHVARYTSYLRRKSACGEGGGGGGVCSRVGDTVDKIVAPHTSPRHPSVHSVPKKDEQHFFVLLLSTYLV